MLPALCSQSAAEPLCDTLNRSPAGEQGRRYKRSHSRTSIGSAHSHARSAARQCMTVARMIAAASFSAIEGSPGREATSRLMHELVDEGGQRPAASR